MRNALIWSKYIEEARALFADRTDLLFACHHWPTWGTDALTGFLERQSDLYRYIHDETLRLANHGHTMHEIAEMVALPKPLAKDFACRGYYGTLKHNVKAVYQFYLGWWDGNPANMDQLPPSESGAHWVRAMGGADKMIAEGQRAFDAGETRWAAEVLNKLVMAEPENVAAKSLLADVYEQLGYQSEAGTWRGLYLTGAQELRSGVAMQGGPNTASVDMLMNMGVEMLLDLLCVKFNASKLTGPAVSVAFEFTDRDEQVTLQVRNGVLTHTKHRSDKAADVKFALTESAFFRLIGKMASAETLIEEGVLRLEGDPSKFIQLAGALDDFAPNFPIVTR